MVAIDKRQKKKLLEKLLKIAGARKIECKKMNIFKDEKYGFFVDYDDGFPDSDMLFLDNEVAPITASCRMPVENLIDLVLKKFHDGATAIYFFARERSGKTSWRSYPKMLIPIFSSIEELEIWADLHENDAEMMLDVSR